MDGTVMWTSIDDVRTGDLWRVAGDIDWSLALADAYVDLKHELVTVPTPTGNIEHCSRAPVCVVRPGALLWELLRSV